MANRITDTSNVSRLLEVLEALEKSYIQVGIFGEDDSEILMIATVQEYGIKIDVTDKMRNYLNYIGIHLKKDTTEINIPERSFLRSSFDQNKNNIFERGNRLLRRVVHLEIPVYAFFEVLGQYIVGLVQEYLTSLSEPTNHPATIEHKGSSNPLVDTGRLRDSITYKVVRS